MSSETKKLLEAFAQNVPWQSAGLLADQERLSDFIIGAYLNGDHAIEQDEYMEIINAHDRERAEGLTEPQKKRSVSYKLYTYQKYEEGIKLLKKFDKK